MVIPSYKDNFFGFIFIQIKGEIIRGSLYAPT